MIDAMTDAQRAKLAAELEAETPEQRLARSKPLNAEQRAFWRKIKKKMGRPTDREGFQTHFAHAGKRPAQKGRQVREAAWPEARRDDRARPTRRDG